MVSQTPAPSKLTTLPAGECAIFAPYRGDRDMPPSYAVRPVFNCFVLTVTGLSVQSGMRIPECDSLPSNM